MHSIKALIMEFLELYFIGIVLKTIRKKPVLSRIKLKRRYYSFYVKVMNKQQGFFNKVYSDIFWQPFWKSEVVR